MLIHCTICPSMIRDGSRNARPAIRSTTYRHADFPAMDRAMSRPRAGGVKATPARL
jgi:hypothetical protein